MAFAEPLKWTLALPCVNSNLTVCEPVEIDEEVFLSKQMAAGVLYYRQTGPVRDGVFFLADSPVNPLPFEAPLQVFLDITNRCNLNCTGCYVPKGSSAMDPEEVIRLADEMAEAGVLGVQLVGGEPTLHPDLARICARMHTRGLKVEIVTNGYDVPETLVGELKGNVSFVAVSLDGTPATHDGLRNKQGCYDPAVETLTRLVQSGIAASVLMSLNRKNCREVEHVARVAKNAGAGLKLKRMIARPGWSDHIKDLYLRRQEMLDLQSEWEASGADALPAMFDLETGGKYSFFGCPGGELYMAVDVKGNAFSCGYERKPGRHSGNVFNENFLTVWERIRSIPLDCDPGCSLRRRCGGPCTINARTDSEAANRE